MRKKVEKGGEDAFFVSNYNGGVIAVADGVSGWTEQNVDPALFSRELMANASSLVGDEEYPNEPPCINKVGSKRLDNQRQSLVSSIRNRVVGLSFCLILVALYEN